MRISELFLGFSHGISLDFIYRDGMELAVHSKILKRQNLRHLRICARNFVPFLFLSYVLLNVDTSLASANLDLMIEYSKLWPNQQSRDRLMGQVIEELKLCRSMLDKVLGGPLEVRRPKLTRTLEKRSAALRQLHLQQIRLLRKFRHQLMTLPEHEKESLLLRLMLTINAIAGGERTTG